MALPKVQKAERVAVVVVELATHAPQDRRWFYEWVEAGAQAETKNRIVPIYGRVELLTGAKATLARLNAVLGQAATSTKVKAIDVFINLHGSDGALTFFDGTHAVSSIRDKINSIKGVREKLRAFNSSACYGATHVKDLLGAGFKVASGARRVNANGGYDFHTFLSAWGNNEAYFSAQEKGNDPKWIKFYDDMAIKWGLSDVDSYKLVEGKSDLTISAEP